MLNSAEQNKRHASSKNHHRLLQRVGRIYSLHESQNKNYISEISVDLFWKMSRLVTLKARLAELSFMEQQTSSGL